MAALTQKHNIKEIKLAEESVLSAIIYYYPQIVEIIDISDISPHIFTTPAAKEIFKSISNCEINQEQFDIVFIYNNLKLNCKEEKLLIACDQYLTKLTDSVQYYNIQQHISLLIEHKVKSKLNLLCEEILQTPLSSKQFADTIEKWEKSFCEITSLDKSTNYITSEEAVNQYTEQCNILKNDGNNFFKTGYWHLDSRIKGLKPGQFVVIASRPGVGKTTFALNLICNNLDYIKQKDQKKQPAIGIFSLEMSNESLIEKLIAINTKIELQTLQKLMEGYSLKTYEMDLINKTKKTIANSNLLFCDESNITMGKILATIKIWARQYDLKVVIIDYLQLINLPNEKEYQNINQYQKIGMISRHLKILTMNLNICIVALAQLNRKFEDRKSNDKSPILSDLRESGSIEQDSDIVLFLYPKAIKEKFDGFAPQIDYDNVDISLKVGKNRHGSVGTVNFTFEKKNGIFRIENNENN